MTVCPSALPADEIMHQDITPLCAADIQDQLRKRFAYLSGECLAGPGPGRRGSTRPGVCLPLALRDLSGPVPRGGNWNSLCWRLLWVLPGAQDALAGPSGGGSALIGKQPREEPVVSQGSERDAAQVLLALVPWIQSSPATGQAGTGRCGQSAYSCSVRGWGF